MRPEKKSKYLKPHKVSVIFGSTAVDVYRSSPDKEPALRRLGAMKDYFFTTLPELNAFLLGIEEGNGYSEALAVES